VAQKARRKAEAKTREEARRRRVVEEKKKKRILEYFQQLWNKVLEEEATLLEGAEGSQIVGSKYKETSLRNDADHWPSKKAKGKQLARYRGDTGLKLGDANLCERCVYAGQDCLVHNSR